ncbi:two-component system, sensor histidine kinase YcbA [Secundilactobacillus oryzae JCM 18671]|uniref:histidine kinase n=1 Tax=Secundilactobacillus oryzae JCM 18671 TaxID=1291743 RepID=A0A081BHN3_9LACO|nr:sensor histidine kinase [Secundilactobacillus oryzae]GAK47551.1 two-component system, sensor histidine kinase YcbA [Secundilactobacillus oryzae JCM 18671]
MFRQNRFIMHERYQRILIAATCIALASQVNFQTYTPGFILTLSVFLLPVFLYFNADLNPLQLTAAIAFASPVFRGLLLFIGQDASVGKILQFIATDMVFYLSYGVLYYFLYWRHGQRNNSSFLLTIIICDYVSNLLEVSLLTGFTDYSYRLFQILFVAALVRSLCSGLFAILYHYFTLMLRDENHERRYYHFIWISSSIKSEVYFMQKNITEIENIMKNAYLLNQDLQELAIGQKQKAMALDIARDVHEVKKDYQNVIRGLGDSFSDEQNEAMPLADILRVTTDYIRESIKTKKQSVVIDVHNHVDLVIPSHYYVVSILSNLIFNGVDALDHTTNGRVRVTVVDDGSDILVDVSDNGSGMDDQTLGMIFQPGFTTKFNETTGNVYRGIGLSHVKIIVEEQFGGNITVDSTLGKGTVFHLTLNKQKLMQEVTA